MRHTVCLVSPGNLASNPRLLKEANALHAAGYGVTVVVCAHRDALRPFDDEIAASVPWRAIRVTHPAGLHQRSRAAGWLARRLTAAGRDIPVGLAARAAGGPVAALRRAVASVRADLYIAHYTAALPAAAAAARQHGGLLGFDAEDFHPGEGTGAAGEAFRMEMVAAVERAVLPACAHVTAAAPMIGEAYAKFCGLKPVTVLNVFPLAMAPTEQPRRATGEGASALRAYWFSQTVGPDRGLQAFLHAMARAERRVTLDIRGGDRWGHGQALMALAQELGIAARVRLLPVASPEEMVRAAASYDVGLSLEGDVSLNRGLCLTNKIFTYLLAGVPVVLSDTPAQRALALELGVAACVVSLADPDGMAAALDRLAGSPAHLAEAAATAWRLGRERYNWDVEQHVLLRAVAAAFGSRR